MAARIEVQRREGDGAGASCVFQFELGEVVIGRSERADICLPDAVVSLIHARVLVGRGGNEIRDEGSTNGTFLAGRQLEPGAAVALPRDGEVVIGPYRLLSIAPRAEAATGPRDTASFARQLVLETLGTLGAVERRPYVEVLDGPSRGRRAALERQLTIGRDERCGLCIADADASRHHAELRSQGGGFLLADRGSKNGTWVNDERACEPRPLRHGDVLRVGRTELRFVDPAEELLERLQRPTPPPREVGNALAPRAGEARGAPPAGAVQLAPGAADELVSPQVVAEVERVTPAPAAPARDRMTWLVGAVLVAAALALIAYLSL